MTEDIKKRRRLKILLVRLHAALKLESDEMLLNIQTTALGRRDEFPVYARISKSIDYITDSLLASRLKKANKGGNFTRNGVPVNPIIWDDAYHVLNNEYEIDKAKTAHEKDPFCSEW